MLKIHANGGRKNGDRQCPAEPVPIFRPYLRNNLLAARDVVPDHVPVQFSAGAAFFVQTLTIDNHGPAALGAGWHLYFNFVRRILNDGEGDGVTVEDLAGQGLRVHKADTAASGDFYVLEPMPSFMPIPAGQQRTVTFLAEAWAILKTDAPAAFHIGFDGDRSPPRAVPATVTIDANDPAQTTRFSGDVMPVDSPATRHA